MLPNREQAIELLHKNKCPQQVINHCIAVANLALETAKKISSNGLEVNLELVEAGALLHDLGRSKNHTVDHCTAPRTISSIDNFRAKLRNAWEWVLFEIIVSKCRAKSRELSQNW